MAMINLRFLACVLTLCGSSGAAPFVNLGFEEAIRPGTPGPTHGPAVELIPGWTLTLGGELQQRIAFDDFGIGSPFASLISKTFLPETVIEGNLMLFLRPGLSQTSPREVVHYHLFQTGEVPDNARSLRFQGVFRAMEVRVNGVPLQLYDESPEDRWYAADVSAFAGETVTIDFGTTAAGPSDLATHGLDDIGFSPKPAIPEPTSVSLLVGGAAVLWLLGLRRTIHLNGAAQ
jgi:hypothetical protein